MTTRTRSISVADPPASIATEARAPGLVCVFANGRATCVRYPAVAGSIVLGRAVEHATVVDDQVSRRHATAMFDGARWTFEDLASRNGTWVDGRRIDRAQVEAPRVIRIGGALLVPSDDVTAHDAERLRHANRPVIGARLSHTLEHIAQIATASSTLHIAGESGAGKELAAQHFHHAGPRTAGRFVPVNCATIPAHLAERVLFGARRGAYTGATSDATGLVQSAEGGTLFLDEIAELDLAVQAKLLRLLDSGEVLPLGASQPARVTLGICTASHTDLARAVTAQRFRDDLRYRISEPHVDVPPLRERTDEIAWHIQHVLDAMAISPHVDLVERCLLAPWSGNVRELRASVRAAATSAQLRGARIVRATDLSTSAAPQVAPARLTDDRIREALRETAGNVTRAARTLGVHRNQIRRWLDKHKLVAN